MRQNALVVLIAIVVLAAPIVPASGRPEAAGIVCGQMKGPYAKFWSSVTGLKLQGTEWTVLATGVPCSTALNATPGLLHLWAKAKVGATLTLASYHCLKMTDRAYSGSGVSSGGFVCGSGPGAPVIFGNHTFAVRMTDGWSTAQIKQYLGLG